MRGGLIARAQVKLLRWRSTLRGTALVELLRVDGADIGERVFLGNRTYVDEGFAWLITIEDDVTLAPHVMVLAHDPDAVWRAAYSFVAGDMAT